MDKTKVKVIIPRVLSGEKEGQIKTMYNVTDLPDTFEIFGGKYKKIKEETL